MARLFSVGRMKQDEYDEDEISKNYVPDGDDGDDDIFATADDFAGDDYGDDDYNI